MSLTQEIDLNTIHLAEISANENLERYKKRSSELAKLTKDKIKGSKWYQQNAFTNFELMIQPMTSMVGGIWFYLKGEAFVTSLCMAYAPESPILRWYVRFWFYVACIYLAILCKHAFYSIFGWIYGIEPTSANDDFWLYDYPINPMFIPSFTVFKRSKMGHEEFMRMTAQRLGRSHRAFVKLQKYFGKYFVVPVTDSEYRNILHTNA